MALRHDWPNLIVCTYLIFKHCVCLEVNWGSSTEAQRYNDTVSALLQMSHIHENTKTYNPQLLVLGGIPKYRPALLDMGHLITKYGSFMIVADINEVVLSYLLLFSFLRCGW